jgi:hypothetical protein
VAFWRALARFLFQPPRRDQPRPLVIPPDLDESSAPHLIGSDAACTGCDAVVPFASMTLSGDGYFCPGCARRR